MRTLNEHDVAASGCGPLSTFDEYLRSIVVQCQLQTGFWIWFYRNIDYAPHRECNIHMVEHFGGLDDSFIKEYPGLIVQEEDGKFLETTTSVSGTWYDYLIKYTGVKDPIAYAESLINRKPG